MREDAEAVHLAGSTPADTPLQFNMNKNMTRSVVSIIGDITQYLSNREGQYCHVAEMSKELNYTYTQIRCAINSKRYEDEDWGSRIAIITRGSTWMWKQSNHENEASIPLNGTSNEKVKSSSFEQIGITKTGNLILQDENGNLYRASELT